jgi:hypothetical protein
MRYTRNWGLLLLLCLVLTSYSEAQLTAGSVVGTTKDPSGAVVPGAQISIKHSSTGTLNSTVASDQGFFSFPVVPIGNYEFTASAPGFATATGAFTVELNTVRTLSVQFKVGTGAETVQVTDAAAPIETASSQLSDTFSRREVLDIPAASVNVNNLA